MAVIKEPTGLEGGANEGVATGATARAFGGGATRGNATTTLRGPVLMAAGVANTTDATDAAVKLNLLLASLRAAGVLETL